MMNGKNTTSRTKKLRRLDISDGIATSNIARDSAPPDRSDCAFIASSKSRRNSDSPLHGCESGIVRP
ncbi:unnamed protein product [Chondrus crispus]|uniref:Uncharacterized protein n=1 Tax=Chondrus crispus TaxID=2769 RepID=R7QNB4_CHOCR|nr:unnamed protein product [Chondrus crispus]CDF39972.1 unnamed protein product [Chondrus crispus]|eukprot:XP_005710266.1 unnamed protein product [Chondrus crispus]